MRKVVVFVCLLQFAKLIECFGKTRLFEKNLLEKENPLASTANSSIFFHEIFLSNSKASKINSSEIMVVLIIVTKNILIYSQNSFY